MYLSTNEHDQLRTIVMGFEVPFRTYISRQLTTLYKTPIDFGVALDGITLTPGLSSMYSSEFGKIKANPHHYYTLLENVVKACNDKCVPVDTDVPYVATLITLYELFRNELNEFYKAFPDHWLMVNQMEKLKYVRNKLDHPQSKTLQTDDMYPVLSFINEAIVAIFVLDEECFWDKTQEDIEKEVLALETRVRTNPISINNFSSVPFTETSIVCRQREIEMILKFVYGNPGALKKKSSLCIFGYGGVGKTAIVTEAIKVIVRDVSDNVTVNGYKPKFILYFSAKNNCLNYSLTTGKLMEETLVSDFSTCYELECLIYQSLGIDSFVGFNDDGIIVIDNLESVEQSERDLIRGFIDNNSPLNVQYIITSRNEEPYDERIAVEGFQGRSGIDFIDTFIEENNLEIELSVEEKKCLLDASKGNTLVLVLSLQRLDTRITTVPGIVKDLNQSTVASISRELSSIPKNGYEIVSEFMFKNTFEELKSMYEDKGELLNALLRVFAVYPTNSIDIFTICLVTDLGYQDILPMVDLLCKYLILEKKEEKYSLNPFAEKYIIQKLLPDATTSERLSSDITRSIDEVRSDLRNLESDIKSNSKVKSIISEWSIEYDGDKIAAAKIYKVYRDSKVACNKGDRFHVETSFEEFSQIIKKIEKTTMHPYVLFQKARILQLYSKNSDYITSITPETIISVFSECIWSIKTNSLYYKIMSTKTYASVLWIFGLYLTSAGKNNEAIKYLEDSMRYFEKIDSLCSEYFQCMSKLATLYLNEYEKIGDVRYLDRAKTLGSKLYEERGLYSSDTKTKHAATELNARLKSM